MAQQCGNPFRGEKGETALRALATKQFEFYRIFDSWHPGLNQLKTFKKLSFHLSTPNARAWRGAMEV